MLWGQFVLSDDRRGSISLALQTLYRCFFWRISIFVLGIEV
jgi:hypothetical protein